MSTAHGEKIGHLEKPRNKEFNDDIFIVTCYQSILEPKIEAPMDIKIFQNRLQAAKGCGQHIEDNNFYSGRTMNNSTTLTLSTVCMIADSTENAVESITN